METENIEEMANAAKPEAEVLAERKRRLELYDRLTETDSTGTAGKIASPALQLQPKVTAATLGGSIATVAIVVLEANGVQVTAELGAAIATISAAFMGWAARS
jgi:hypothetical protein